MSKKTKKGKGRTLPMSQRHAVPPRRVSEPRAVVPVQHLLGEQDEDGAEVPVMPPEATAMPMLIDGEPVVLNTPTPALVKVLEIALEEGGGPRDRERVAPLVIPANIADHLRRDGMNRLSRMLRVQGDGIDFVRAFARVELDYPLLPGKDVQWQGWVDLPTRYVGMMLEAARPREEQQPEEYAVRIGGATAKTRPRWQGSWTFDKVWDQSWEFSSRPDEGIRSGNTVTTVFQKVLGVEVIGMLRQTHLVRVEADQVEVLPEWDDLGQAFDYAQDLHLPFDPLYLEFEGAGGVAPVHTERYTQPEASITLRAALLYRENGHLVISPFGEIVVPEGGETMRQAVWREAKDAEERRKGSYFPAGRVEFGTMDFRHPDEIGIQELITMSQAADGAEGRLRTELTAVRADVFGEGLAGMVTLPLPIENVDLDAMEPMKRSPLTPDGKVTPLGVKAYAGAVLSMAIRTLAAMSIMESDVVVVEDAPMEKRDRKRAESRGWEIAQQVYIRPVRKGGQRVPSDGESHIEFSHRFWVRGHTKHFGPHTRMAQNRPDLVRPCTRNGDAMCDGGVCRRVWTPPFVKGPDDKPLVMKSLVKKVA